jgi:hypothetical protein
MESCSSIGDEKLSSNCGFNFQKSYNKFLNFQNQEQTAQISEVGLLNIQVGLKQHNKV